MKKNLSILSLAILASFSACSPGETDKAAELAKLKNEQAEIQGKIAALEKEVNAGGKGGAVNHKTVPVSVIKLQPATFNHYLEVQGKVDFEQNVMVSAKVPGVLTSVRVNRGDRVSKGQTLATIDASVLDQSIAEVKSSLDLAQTVYQKQKNLWDQKIGTEIQFLTAKNNKESLENKLATLQQQRDQYNIKAPISGIVDEVMPKSGEAVAPGVGIIRVVNPTGTKIVADLSEAYATKVKKGDKAIIYFPDTGKEAAATVKVTSQAINQTNRTFTIELALEPGTTKDISLRPNMVAVVKINDYRAEDAIVIPVNLVQRDEKNSYVYVVKQQDKKDIAQRMPVTLGKTYQDKVEVLSGLSSGDVVISTGYQNLNEGQPVTFTQDEEVK